MRDGFLLAGLLVSASLAYGGSAISAADAINHVGDYATVCGTVASATYASNSRGQPTFLNLDRPYPNHVFTALIWGTVRPRFGQPEVTYAERRICVSGLIRSYRGKPEIVVDDPGQIVVP